MTGFGRGEASNGTVNAIVELSSVNRKQAEIVFNLPRSLSEHDADLRKVVLEKVSRGRVNGLISISFSDASQQGLTLDSEKIIALENQFKTLSESLGREVRPNASDFINIPDIFITSDIDSETASPLVKKALIQALSALIEMRQKEGDALKRDSITRICTLTSILNKIKERAPIVIKNYRTKLIQRITDSELLESTEELLNDERIIKEIAIYADRSDITEEITRFQSHLDKFNEYLKTDSPVGRPLDFLCQELNRELNTIGSKANDFELSHLIVKGKTEVEKIREQIQNVE